MSKTELLLYMIGGSFAYTTGIFGFLWKQIERLRRTVTNHHRHELDDLRSDHSDLMDRVTELERTRDKDRE